jgi:hypothetical protein
MVTRRPQKGAHLTPSQKGEAIALWKAGGITLADLAKRFNKRPETFSRLFKKLDIKKGSDAEEAAAKAAAVVEQRILQDVDVHAKRILDAREQHFKMADGMAKLAWSELVRARQAGLDIGALKDLMQTLKLAGDVIGTARKELWAILKIEDSDKDKELDELPELTVRELTSDEVIQLQSTDEEDEMGGGMLPADPTEIPDLPPGS